MDGYAVRSSDVASLPARLVVVGEAVAGKSWHGTLGPGEAVRIMTGAPVPSGADSVQRVEVTSEHDSIVEIHESTLAGQSIIDKASEIRTGQVVIPKGTRLNAAMMAALAAFGYATPKVYRRPVLTVIPTGVRACIGQSKTWCRPDPRFKWVFDFGLCSPGRCYIGTRTGHR